jgi:ribosomal protein L40E
MPHFDENGNETVICQACGTTQPSAAVKWMTVPGTTRMGNVCVRCRAPKPTSLREWCRMESGLDGAALDRYVQRHYGHH